MSPLTLHHGDCLAVLPTIAENSLDACVTDPPYGLEFMGKDWDHGVPGVPFWREIIRVLKPGAHLVAFGGSRTYHRMAVAIEDAGFEIRDSLMWLYGSGFPKSMDVSKAIDRADGAKRERYARPALGGSFSDDGGTTYGTALVNEPITDAAREWEGWGTALKPAFEPIVLARKPLSEKTVAANVLRWGTGALNIDGCRVETSDKLGGGKTNANYVGCNDGWRRPFQDDTAYMAERAKIEAEKVANAETLGRWPANVVHDGSDEVVRAFPNASGAVAPVRGTEISAKTDSVYGAYAGRSASDRRDGGGSAARFFYCAKASKEDRAGSKHPTVKPIRLLCWLARMVTPPGGVILDPFAGSGTTAAAAVAERFGALLIEQEAEYAADIRRRIAALTVQPALL